MLVLCVWIAGCGGGCGGATAAPADDPTEHRAGADDTRPTPREAVAEPPVEPGPRPVLRVLGEPDPHSRSVALRIENRGTENAELSGVVGLQRRSGEAWADVEHVSLDLRFSCEDPVPECVTLAPGAIFIPPPWLGGAEGDQCACERCVPASAGEYRLVVRSCSRAHTIESEPFAISAD